MMQAELSPDQQLALEEYKILVNQLDSSESLFNKWESGYLIVNGFIITLFGNLMLKTDSATVLIMQVFLCMLGAGICYQWARMLGRSLLYSIAREERIKLLENFLSRPVKPATADGLVLFQSSGFIKDYVYKRTGNWKNKTSTYKIRLQLPIVFIFIWLCILSIAVLIYLL